MVNETDPNQKPQKPSFALFASATAKKASDLPPEYSDCPPDSQELGRATWTFLHTMAAYYPETPTKQEKTHLQNFMTSFSWLYPCGVCADHLRQDMKKHPPPLESGEKFSKWLCDTHNKVNKQLGKPIFDCSKVFERWRDGPSDGRCDWGLPTD
ncbi:hypothetical protein BB559_003493 [Furculomyces boomerangus]|uniref:Sulfhydryl oxidase n=2 Tax=Harpellales TaxID=61421 RepID=A0A2T9YKZ1_9FUNG|nr:hypothetical protein BB559_005294 [Furculomyces boomerangus]PVU93010.1 hypothetical protein BB559_003493 [Furculomyces boomerangus]PVZ98941.1 hypothetical protein BB558_005075 [Smittium angustum]